MSSLPASHDPGVPGLQRQLLRWIDAAPRTYGETMDAWRTSCPRLPVWEDSLADGLVCIEQQAGPHAEARVVLTKDGRSRL